MFCDHRLDLIMLYISACEKHLQNQVNVKCFSEKNYLNCTVVILQRQIYSLVAAF